MLTIFLTGFNSVESQIMTPKLLIWNRNSRWFNSQYSPKDWDDILTKRIV